MVENVPSFSVQYLLDCDDSNFGCDGGWMTDAYNWTAKNGIVRWNDYYKGYQKKQKKCKQPKKKLRFYNAGGREEPNTSNNFLKARLAK